MKMTVEMDEKRNHHHSSHLPFPLGRPFNSSSNMGSFGSKGDGVLEIIRFHWSTTGIHWLSLADLMYSHSHQHIFYSWWQRPRSSTSVPQPILSSIPILWLFPSSETLPWILMQRVLHLSNSRSSSSHWMFSSSWTIHMVSESRAMTTENAGHSPTASEMPKNVSVTALQHSVWEAQSDYILLHCKTACQGPNPAP